MTLALLHEVTDALADCELTFLPRQPFDVARARAQHQGYAALLRRLGCEVQVVNTSPDHADAVFVEDCAVVLDEVAVSAAMGAASRATEVEHLLPVLSRYRKVLRLEPPAALEGGDVLRIGRTLYVGRSVRTNQSGIDALAAQVRSFGYRVVPVDVHGCLHLKTAVTALDDRTLLANPAWIDAAPFADLHLVAVDAAEPFAANMLRVATSLVTSASHPRTTARLCEWGYAVHTVAIDELEKAEAGVTCLSLLLEQA